MKFLIVLPLILLLIGINFTKIESASLFQNCDAAHEPSELSLDSNEDFNIQEVLLAGFNYNEKNRINAYKGGFTSKRDAQHCIPVTYTIDWNCTSSINETCYNKNQSMCLQDNFSYLWTIFDPTTPAGDILIRLAAYDLRVFGFELCDIYKNPVEITITVPEEVFLPINCLSLCRALADFTIKLPGLSGQQMQTDNQYPSFDGYAVHWNGNTNIANYDVIVIYMVFIVLTSKIIIIFFVYDIYKKIFDYHLHKQTNCWYYIYWAAQFLIFAGLCVLIYFARTKQKNITAFWIFIVSLVIDMIIASLVTIIFSYYTSYTCCPCGYREKVRKKTRSNEEEFPEEPTKDTKTESEEQPVNDSETPSEITPLIDDVTNPRQMYTDSNDAKEPEMHSQSQAVAKEYEISDSKRQESANNSDSICIQMDYPQLKSNVEVVSPPLSLCYKFFKLFNNDPCYCCPCNNIPIISFKKKNPLKCCTSCCEIHVSYFDCRTTCSFERFCTVLMKGISLFIFLAFISYLTQAFPAIAISYYLKPTDSLIILGIFELAIIILLIEIALLLFLMERCTWFCHVEEYKEIPKEACKVETQAIDSDTEEITENTGCLDNFVYKEGQEYKLKFSCCKKKCKCIHVIAVLQIIASLCLIGASVPLIYYLINIVIHQTSGNDQFRDIFAIVPTIILNMWLIYKGNVQDVLKDVMNQMRQNMHVKK